MDMGVEEQRELIKLYEVNGILWNPRHPDYYNKQRREKVWYQIAQKLDLDVNFLKKKIQSLTGSYRREKSRERRGRRDAGPDGDGSYTSKWFAYQWFQFLNKNPKPKKESCDGTVIEETEDESTSVTHANSADPIPQVIQITSPYLDASDAAPPSSDEDHKANKTRTIKRPIKRLRPATTNKDNIVGKVAYQALEKTVENTDNLDSFGRHIASELRKYNPKILPYVKKALLDVLFQADIGQFDQRQTIFTTSSRSSTTPSNAVVPNFKIASGPRKSKHRTIVNNQNVKIEFLEQEDLTDLADPLTMNGDVLGV